MDSREAWAVEKRPVFARLPGVGYQDNPLVDAVTSWVDKELVETSEVLQQYHTRLDPDTCPDDQLDYLAWLVGLSDEYWDTQWHPNVKRGMIENAYWIFNHLGTLEAVKRVLDIHGFSYNIWVDGHLIFPFPLGSSFGEAKLRYYVQVPIAVARNDVIWREMERSIHNYSAAIVSGKVVYDAFRLGYSRLGDPFF